MYYWRIVNNQNNTLYRRRIKTKRKQFEIDYIIIFVAIK